MYTFYKNKKNIIQWLDKYKIIDYILIPDQQYGYVIDVNNRVNLQNKKLKFIPVKFNSINGDFSCSGNRLTSLEFCPNFIDGDFFCSHNKLTSLEFSPKTVKGHYYCDNNLLTSLEFCTEKIAGNLNCSKNQIKSLEFCPEFVSGYFYCYKNIALKDIQEITDFDKIYLEHKKTLTLKLSNSLENDLIKNINKKVSIKI